MLKIFILFICLPIIGLTQSPVDTIIYTDAFTVYFDLDTKLPAYVKYKLYRGGGDCKRSTSFTSSSITYSNNDYYKSGYDRGHLVNCEDLAYNCDFIKSTFHYYNVVPQTANLNRGGWKYWETKIRDMSQTDSLLIICGPILDSSIYLTNETLIVPTKYFKLVKNLNTNNIFILLFDNTKLSSVVEINRNRLWFLLKYEIFF